MRENVDLVARDLSLGVDSTFAQQKFQCFQVRKGPASHKAGSADYVNMHRGCFNTRLLQLVYPCSRIIARLLVCIREDVEKQIRNRLGMPLSSFFQSSRNSRLHACNIGGGGNLARPASFIDVDSRVEKPFL